MPAPTGILPAGVQAVRNPTQFTFPATEPWDLIQDDPESIKQEAVAKLLRNVHTILLGVEKALNRGSVSASIAALRELVHQTGGNVTFQVVYEKSAEQNLATVISSFKPSMPRQQIFFYGRQMLFVREGHLKQEDGTSVIDVLYPIAQEFKFGPPDLPEPTVIAQFAQSPKTGSRYERYSDGKVFYRPARQPQKMFELVLSNLRPVNKDQWGFAKAHLVQPSDLQITMIFVPDRPRLMFRPSRENPRLKMKDPRGDEYLFEYDEEAEVLTLIEKNDRSLPPQSYARDNSDDDKTTDRRRLASNRLKKLPPSGHPLRGAPLSRWLSAGI